MTAPLDPKGTLRARFGPRTSRDADIFRRLGVGARQCDLGDEGLYLAEELVAADQWLGGSDPVTLGILVLALMIVQREGSTRLPLASGPLRPLVADIGRLAGIELDLNRTLKAIGNLTNTPLFNSVIGAGDARLPLIVDDGCLYTQRSRWLEQRVAARLAARLAAPATAVTCDDPALKPEQRAAVQLAVGGKLAVVTGGPGTGKTVVAAAIVRGFAKLGITHVALAAQTGKAANRLTQVMAEQMTGDAPVAQTLHRLLGSRGHHFAHHAQSPLPVGALIIDEASMIDLELMDAVLDALPDHVPLVLIGDANQLPAIDAGQVLADLADPAGVAQPRVAVLAHSHRMDASDARGRAVLEAAAAVRAGTPAKLTGAARTPGTLTFSGVEWVDTAAAAHPHDASLAVATTAWHHGGGPAAQRLAERVFEFVDGHIVQPQRAELEHLWHLLGRTRILTVTRAQPTGSLAINAHLHELALDRLTVSGRPELVPGEPVMITQNDYQRGLFNGDQGIIIRADEGLDRHHYRAVFRVGRELVPFAIEALRDRLELSWAITVHKSQGSELDTLALLLPHDDLPLVTRELLYTGITRARTGVVIAGSRMILAAGCKRVAHRHSGLDARLRATLR